MRQKSLMSKGPAGMRWPHGIALWQGRLAPADRLSGQPDFASEGDNGWGIPGRDTLCWPYGLSVLGWTFAIADSGNNLFLLWDLAP
ncbi:MAG: hypothetical protein QNJ94_19360 [Alphaproteobacteria bacterium]|nr:hypothetical protein [Alphaproteobacteria bacterium]